MKKLLIYLKIYLLKAVAAISRQFGFKRRRQEVNLLEDILFI
jgi:hypothetical protein